MEGSWKSDGGRGKSGKVRVALQQGAGFTGPRKLPPAPFSASMFCMPGFPRDTQVGQEACGCSAGPRPGPHVLQCPPPAYTADSADTGVSRVQVQPMAHWLGGSTQKQSGGPLGCEQQP